MAREVNEPCPQEIIRNQEVSLETFTDHEVEKSNQFCVDLKGGIDSSTLSAKQTMKSIHMLDAI